CRSGKPVLRRGDEAGGWPSGSATGTNVGLAEQVGDERSVAGAADPVVQGVPIANRFGDLEARAPAPGEPVLDFDRRSGTEGLAPGDRGGWSVGGFDDSH